MKITTEWAEELYQTALKNGKIQGQKAVIFYLKKVLEYRLNLLKTHFPKDTLHAIAVKTFDHPQVLQHIASLGFGLEAASFEEVLLAKEAGLPNDKIVFDSPVKTLAEIQYCHEHLPGILLNANSLEELKRYPESFSGQLGLRINPLVHLDVPGIFNVSTSISKFGVPISQFEQIVEACLKHSQISCLHIHIGSSIKDFSSNLIAVKKLLDLAKTINQKREELGIEQKIDTLDIGGGIDFELEGEQHSIPAFVQELQQIPHLFDDFNIITEYGAFVHKACSFVVSHIEYVIANEPPLPSTIFLHVGADLFVRKVYSNLNLHYPYSVLRMDENDGREKQLYNVAGPLCFAGDILFENISLPKVKEGDQFFIYETGANTLSMWSKHCNRERPEFLLA